MELKNPKICEIINFLGKYLHGKDEALRLSLLCFFTKGHLLIEDLPGLGKTTLAVGIAKILGMSFGRVQCTNDLLPSDITGVSIFNKESEQFNFRKGPIFNNIVLVDEINRATPKTQSALLEAMGEKQVTVEGVTTKLERPFFVMATQNPLDQFGTFPLPESQMDRFIMRISIGFPSREAEKQIIMGGSQRSEIYNIEPLIRPDELNIMIDDVNKNVDVSEKMYEYILDITGATRNSGYLTAGLSTRAALFMIRLAKANAWFCGRNYIIPEDVTTLSKYVMTHRLIFKENYTVSDKEGIVKELVDNVKKPI